MYMQEREYLKANDSYLRLSIGNAPWPIGVTMVGIHERSAREKISRFVIIFFLCLCVCLSCYVEKRKFIGRKHNIFLAKQTITHPHTHSLFL